MPRILPPVSVAGLKPEDANNERLVRDLSRHVQNIVQKNIDHMLARRKSVLWGHVLDGTSPEIPPFQRAAPATGV